MLQYSGLKHYYWRLHTAERSKLGHGTETRWVSVLDSIIIPLSGDNRNMAATPMLSLSMAVYQPANRTKIVDEQWQPASSACPPSQNAISHRTHVYSQPHGQTLFLQAVVVFVQECPIIMQHKNVHTTPTIMRVALYTHLNPTPEPKVYPSSLTRATLQHQAAFSFPVESYVNMRGELPLLICS